MTSAAQVFKLVLLYLGTVIYAEFEINVIHLVFGHEEAI